VRTGDAIAGRCSGSLLTAWRRQVPRRARGKRVRRRLVVAVEAIGEDPLDPVRRFRLGGRVLKLPVRWGTGHRTLVFGVPQRPDDPSPNEWGQIPPVGATVTVLLIGEAIGGPRQATPRLYGHQTLVPERTDQALERQRRDVTHHRPPFSTPSALGGHQGMASHVRSPLAIA
jgi:hypothetical protein